MSRKPRLFFHVQHLLGIGHQMRAAAITRACQKAGFETHYVSGGFEDRPLNLNGAVFHQLPPVRVIDRDFSKLACEDGHLIDELWWERRSNATLSLFREIDPDILLIEGFPFARRKFGRELLPVIEEARNHCVPVCASIRDILVAPSKDEKRLKALEVAQNQFDHLLVHGDPVFVRLEDSLSGAEQLAEKIHYTGYVDGGDPVSPTEREREIVVSVGGGAVGQTLLETAVATARLLGSDWHWRLLAGPNLPDGVVAILKTSIEGMNITLEPARPDFRMVLSQASLSVSQAGYNTVMDIVAAGCPALLIPFSEGGESEQPTRARLLAEKGLVHVIDESALTAQSLARVVSKILTKTQVKIALPFDINGANKTADLLRDFVKYRGK